MLGKDSEYKKASDSEDRKCDEMHEVHKHYDEKQRSIIEGKKISQKIKKKSQIKQGESHKNIE